MLKYVSRHVRDSVERTCKSVLQRKSFTCNKKIEEDEQKKVVITKPKQYQYAIFETPDFKKQTGGEDFKNYKKKYQSNRYQGASPCSSWLSALTWSSALIAGWYASQLICLHRRNQTINFDPRNCYSRYLWSTNRAAHNGFTSVKEILKNAVPAPPAPEEQAYNRGNATNRKPNRKPTKSFEEYTEKYKNFFQGHEGFFNNEYKKHQEAQTNVYNVNNTKNNSNISDNLVKEAAKAELEVIYETPAENIKELLPQEEKTQQELVDFAYNNLLNVVSEIEFQMGVQNLQAGDYLTAVSHLKLSTSHSHPGATFNLALCYEEGLGVKKDLKIAMQLYELSASLGHPRAMYNLGVFYARGLGGLNRDYKQAKKYFKLAADLGQIDAQVALGLRKISEQNEHIQKQQHDLEYNLKNQFFAEPQFRQVAIS